MIVQHSNKHHVVIYVADALFEAKEEKNGLFSPDNLKTSTAPQRLPLFASMGSLSTLHQDRC